MQHRAKAQLGQAADDGALLRARRCQQQRFAQPSQPRRQRSRAADRLGLDAHPRRGHAAAAWVGKPGLPRFKLARFGPNGFSLTWLGLTQLSPNQLSPNQLSPIQLSPIQLSAARRCSIRWITHSFKALPMSTGRQTARVNPWRVATALAYIAPRSPSNPNPKPNPSQFGLRACAFRWTGPRPTCPS